MVNLKTISKWAWETLVNREDWVKNHRENLMTYLENPKLSEHDRNKATKMLDRMSDELEKIGEEIKRRKALFDELTREKKFDVVLNGENSNE